MATPENVGIYFISYLLMHMRYFDSGVIYDVLGVKESENDVQMAIILVAGDIFEIWKLNQLRN